MYIPIKADSWIKIFIFRIMLLISVQLLEVFGCMDWLDSELNSSECLEFTNIYSDEQSARTNIKNIERVEAKITGETYIIS